VKLILKASQATPRCPLCHDDLPAAQTAWARCGLCGTAYHSDCTSLAVGCALLGCPGSLGEGPGEAQFALVVDTSERLSAFQLATLARVARIGEFDAQLKLRRALPWILRFCSRSELGPLRKTLVSCGVAVCAVEVRFLSQGLEPVTAVGLDGGHLVLERAAGKPVRIAPDTPRLVVVGQFEDAEEIYKKREPGTQPRADRRRTRTQFAHVYVDGGPDLELVGGASWDFRFLGRAMRPTGRENFLLLEERLCQGARVDAMLRRASGESVTLSRDGTRTRSSNRPWVRAASRLLRAMDLLPTERTAGAKARG
jgi:hypothetical protein